jgi:putative endonuclease
MGRGHIKLDFHHRRRSYLWGMVAEYLCMGVLMLKGYSVLARRYRNPFGEIDVIAVRGDIVAFIEVKARTRHDEALASVTPAKQQRLLRAASGFIAAHKKYAHHGLRFDVMMVTSPWNITHLKDAWRAS